MQASPYTLAPLPPSRGSSRPQTPSGRSRKSHDSPRHSSEREQQPRYNDRPSTDSVPWTAGSQGSTSTTSLRPAVFPHSASATNVLLPSALLNTHARNGHRRRNSLTLTVDTSDVEDPRQPRANTAGERERGRSFDRPAPDRPSRSLERKRSASLGRPDARQTFTKPASAPPMPAMPASNAQPQPQQQAQPPLPSRSPHRANSQRRPATANDSPSSTKANAPPANVARANTLTKPNPRRADTRTEEITVFISDHRGRFANYDWVMAHLRDLKPTVSVRE